MGIAALACFVAVATAQDAPPAASPAAAAPALAAPASLRHVVIVTIDTVRADRLGCYGYFRDTSPRLDAVAAESLRFTRCLTPIAQTTPSHWSLFTGVGPYEHNVLSNHAGASTRGKAVERGRDTVATLRTVAERFAEAGVKTGGFVGATPVKRSTGLAAGFTAWSEPVDEGRRLGKAVVDDALAFLGTVGDARAFLWVHLFDAHEPLRPPYTPPAYLERFRGDARLDAWLAERRFAAALPELTQRNLTIAGSNDRYDGALRFLDDQLAPLLDRLDEPAWRDSTALVIVADHGTALGQHDHFGHGIVWDEQLRVPLLLRVPGVAPRVVDTPCSTLDLWPMLFGLAPELTVAGVLEQCRGSDVLHSEGAARPIVSTAARSGSDAITAGRWKLVRGKGAPTQLYDLQDDPHELTDVAHDHSDVVDRLSKLLEAEIARQKRAAALHQRSGAEAGTPDPKLLEELRALGYTEDDDSGGGGD
ncbi:MAG: sulfatase-like hydrolase/transferase [Planctomycetes bacterium]|nr:sulfatase-like hydrolase/transferase [Planctomycetota bacterium]